jgi:glycosyltransferase involved in cell wall biosynthesis
MSTNSNLASPGQLSSQGAVNDALRILHVITDLQTGGAEMMLLKLVAAGAVRSEQVVVSLGQKGTIGPRIAEVGVPVHALGLQRSFLNPLRFFPLISLMRRFRPQLIVGWMYHGNVAASLAARASGIGAPVFWNIQQSLYDIRSERWLTARLIHFGVSLSRRTAAIIYNSKTSALQHEALGYRADKRIVIPTGFDCRQFQPNDEARRRIRAELGIGEQTVVIGLIARYHPMKDHVGFLKAAGFAVKKNQNVRFVLAGKGITTDEPTLRRAIEENQIKDHTLLLGERADMPELTASFDIACSASAWGEGSSNAVGEAMACGVPCVVTDVGDSALLVGETGLAVPPKDPQAFADALSQLVEAGPMQRRHLGQAARSRIETEFNLSSIAQRYEDLYRQHLARS